MRCQKPQLLMGQLPWQWQQQSRLLMSCLQSQRLGWSLWTSMLQQEGFAICTAQWRATGATYLCLL